MDSQLISRNTFPTWKPQHRRSSERTHVAELWGSVRLIKTEKKSFSQNCYKVFTVMSEARACRKNAVANNTKFPRFQCNWQSQLSFTIFYHISFLRWIINYCRWSRRPRWTIRMIEQVDWSLHVFERWTEAIELINIISDNFKWHRMQEVFTLIEMSQKRHQIQFPC